MAAGPAARSHPGFVRPGRVLPTGPPAQALRTNVRSGRTASIRWPMAAPSRPDPGRQPPEPRARSREGFDPSARLAGRLLLSGSMDASTSRSRRCGWLRAGARPAACLVVCCVGLGLAAPAAAKRPPAPGLRIVWVGAVLGDQPVPEAGVSDRYRPGAWPAVQRVALVAAQAEAAGAALAIGLEEAGEFDLRGRRPPVRR